MELINQTAVTATLAVSNLSEADRDVRQGLLVAKATFDVGPDGRLNLVDLDPIPVFEEDTATEHGILPADTQVRAGDAMEVMLLGAAYAPRGRAVPERRVELRVGRSSWALDVIGDRVWAGRGKDAQATAPIPFERMPLIWERAYGGTSDVWLDPHALVEVPDPRNPLGRGMDPEPHAVGLARSLGALEGFPRWTEPRLLPNLEHPGRRVRAYGDAGHPYCWAPLPVPMLRRSSAGPAEVEAMIQTKHTDVHEGFYRCLDELVLERAPLGEPVSVEGVHESRDFGFVLPPLRVTADYVLGGRRGERALVPRRLVLLPEESRFYLVYQMDFRMRVTESDERSFRLRLA